MTTQTRKSIFNRPEKAYVHPYFGGVVLGIVLLDGSHPLTWLASLGARMGLYSGGSHVGFVRKLLGMAEGRALSIKD